MSILTTAILSKRIDQLEKRLTSGAPIYGAYWDRSSSPTLQRLYSARGLTARVGIGGQWVENDFDGASIFGEMHRVEDTYGNAFTRIPKFYIRKRKTAEYRTWEVSKHQYPGFYLPKVFWDFERGKELPYFDFGAHKAGLEGGRLTSKPGQPLTYENIVQFRNYAQANNDPLGGIRGYQQLDIHAYDVLQVLMLVEFATLNLQSVMPGFTTGNYSASRTAVQAAAATNTITLTTANANNFVVGQSVSIGTAHTDEAVTGRHNDRTVTAINDNGDGTSGITFDGAPVDIAVGNVIASRGWRNGFSSDIAASSGSIGDGSSKYPCAYRGIESPYGDLWQWVDGVNINDYQAWVAADARDYASNLFTAPYEALAYVNSEPTGYATEMGLDAAHPQAEFPVGVGGSSSTYFADNYWNALGARVALVGGGWDNGSSAGPFCWALYSSSGYAYLSLGGRLLAKPL